MTICVWTHLGLIKWKTTAKPKLILGLAQLSKILFIIIYFIIQSDYNTDLQYKGYKGIMHDWTLECGCNTTLFPFKMGLET